MWAAMTHADERVDHDATITHEAFFDFLEKEIQKVHSFTDKKVTQTDSHQIREDSVVRSTHTDVSWLCCP